MHLSLDERQVNFFRVRSNLSTTGPHGAVLANGFPLIVRPVHRRTVLYCATNSNSRSNKTKLYWQINFSSKRDNKYNLLSPTGLDVSFCSLFPTALSYLVRLGFVCQVEVYAKRSCLIDRDEQNNVPTISLFVRSESEF